ncbi:AraC family transcriptional regulator [Vallitalea okinawensis]|uniref:AraC family transcriptional regulator n=1 Tax=Vallitalea okinawensis TaxID=2078660 RepID=UPI000CFAA394|nr:AraC family transcriptional regulator [Vallitalea okinawensis]
MNYIECIQKSLDYIEENLDQEITVENLAEISLCSKFHFHRLFKAMVGIGVMEYVRKRRLTIAAQKLHYTCESIINIAMDVGYNSHTAFTRAFKGLYDLSPIEYRNKEVSIDHFEHVDVSHRKLINNKVGCIFGPRIFRKSSFSVVGMKITCSFDENKDTRAVPNLWYNFLERRKEIAGLVGEIGFGVSFDSCLGKFFNYIASFEVRDIKSIPEGMEYYTVPSSLYASFLFKFNSDLGRFYEALDYVYGVWLPQSKYKLSNQMDLIEAVDFTQYLKEDNSFEIWIPLQDD